MLCRCGGIAWCDDDVALLYESWWATRRSKVWVIAPGDPTKEPELLFDRWVALTIHCAQCINVETVLAYSNQNDSASLLTSKLSTLQELRGHLQRSRRPIVCEAPSAWDIRACTRGWRAQAAHAWCAVQSSSCPLFQLCSPCSVTYLVMAHLKVHTELY